MYGSSNWEAAQIDMVVGCVEDAIKPFTDKIMVNQNSAEKVVIRGRWWVNVGS